MFKKIICLLLTVLLVCSVAVACKKGGTENTEDSVSNSIDETVSETVPEEDYEILISELGSYVIIYPEDATDELKNSANDLASSLSKKFDIIVSARNDNPVNFKGESQIGEYEIIIGDTRREESEALLSRLKYNDRGYMIFGKKIAIASHDPSTTASLVSEFSSLIRSIKKDATVFFSSDMNKIHRGTYDFEAMTVGTRDISEYSIVYSEGDRFEQALAKKLWRAIAEKCGAMLPMVSDSTIDSDLEIRIGVSRGSKFDELLNAETGTGFATIQGNTVYLCGYTAIGKAVAVESFITGFKAAAGSGTHKLTAVNKTVKDSGAESSMSFNLTADGMNDARAERVIETIVRYLPDTVGLQECSSDWKDAILSELGDYYGYIGTGRDAQGTGLATAILYAKEKYTVKEQGTKWLSYTPDVSSKLGGADANYTYTYAVLENKDGTEFMVLNTQLGKTAAVRNEQAAMLLDFMYEYKDIPVIFTADMNCAEGSEAFNILVCEFMRHAAAICTIDKMGSFTHQNITDTLLVYDKYIDVSYMEVAHMRIDGAYASDSRAAYIEYTVDMAGTDYTESGTSDDKLTVVPDRDGNGYLPVDPAS